MKKHQTTNNRQQRENGQSIVEVIVALALIAMVILGLVKVTIVSVNNASFAKDQRAATQYAQEGIEYARKCREEDEVAFWHKSCPELAQPADPRFTRTITFNNSQDTNVMNVLVEVSWSDSKGVHKSSLETNLTKW